MVCDPTRASPPLPKKPADFLGRRQAIASRSGAGKCSIADRSRQTGTGHPRSYSDDLCRVSRFRAVRRGDSRRCAAFDRRRHRALDVNGPKLSAEQTILNYEFRVQSFACTVISFSTGASWLSDATPTAARVCWPRSPQSCTSKSDSPFATLGMSVNPGATLT